MVGHPKESDDYRTANPTNTSRRKFSGTKPTAPSSVTQFLRTKSATKIKSITKKLKSYLKNSTLEETPEGLFPAFLLMVSKGGTPTEKANFKDMIAAGTEPVMHVHMSPGNPCV